MKLPILAALLVLPAAGALAHATFETGDVAQDSSAKFVLRVPHGCGEEATLTVRIRIPEGVIAVKPMPKAGWTLQTVKVAYANTYELWGSKVTEGVKEIVWTGGELPTDWYDEFVFQGRVTDSLAVGTTVFFPAVQECRTGAERWIEIPAAGQDPDALESPAPGVKVVEKPHGSH